MKKTILAISVLTILAQSSSAFADPYGKGVFYEDTVVPLNAANAKISSKYGESTCKNILGLVQLGKCGINDAMKSGNIRNVNYTDVHREGSFILEKYTTRVYGD